MKSVSKGVFSGPYFPVFSTSAGKYEPEKTPYLDSFHAGRYGKNGWAKIGENLDSVERSNFTDRISFPRVSW